MRSPRPNHRIPTTVLGLTLAILVVAGPAEADFLVRDVRSSGVINNIAAADALLGGSGIVSEATSLRPFIDMFDVDGNTGEGSGRFANNQAFPNNRVGVDDNNFAIRATGLVVIPTAGVYTFAVNTDDGSRLRIDQGAGFVTVIDDGLPHPPQDRLGTITFAAAGRYAIDYVYFEQFRQATVELSAARGQFNTFDPSAFRLVGDVANGGLAVVVPEPAGLATMGIGALGLLVYPPLRRRLARS